MKNRILFLLLTILISIISPSQDALPPESYLIITPEPFLPVLQPLIMLKQLQGFDVATLIVINESPDQIRQKILDLMPAYVLLVGDVNFIPAFTAYNPRVIGIDDNGERILSFTPYPTDLYYGVTDDGWVPSIKIGRLPARTAYDLAVMITALINYRAENDSIALFNNSPYEFDHLEAQYIFTELAQGSGTLLDMWETGEIIATDEMVSAFNTSPALTIYNGHSSTGGWVNLHGENLSSIQSSSNVVISFACSSADIESTQSFGELWLESGKAVSYIGTTSETHFVYGDDILHGMMEGYYAGDHRFGSFILNGLTWYQQLYDAGAWGETIWTPKRYWERFILLGDPALDTGISNADVLSQYYFPLILNS